MTRSAEFEIIQHDFIDAGFPGAPQLVLGPGDDCAIIAPDPGQELCVTIDTLVSGIHFPAGGAATMVANRALMTNLSDLAAMGASPLAFTIALTLPEYSAHWTREFAAALRDGARRYGIALAGGDLTRGPLAVTIQAMGQVPRGSALTRAGARPGDDLYVSGTLGDAAVGLRIAAGDRPSNDAAARFLLQRFECPEPRIALGIALRGVAHAAIDVSDGLLQDLGHILERSEAGAVVQADQVPLSAELVQLVGHDEGARIALTAGDDYELCFTAPPSRRERIAALAEGAGVAATRIGTITAARELRCLDRSGQGMDLPQFGYQHF